MKKNFEFEDLLLNQNLLEYFNDLESLPTVPDIYTKINQMIKKNESADRITREIETDQSLSVRILKVANSAFYGNNIGSVKQAIMYIGLNNIKSIILSNSIFEKNNLKKAEILWEHALLTNKIAGYIYQKILLRKISSEYSSAGLLHDIGRVLILSYFEKENTQVENRLDNNPVDLEIRTQYEYEVFGFDHTKLGGYLLNWWGIPFPVVEAAVFHHDPLNSSIINNELVSVIYLANIIAWEITEQEKKGEIINVEVIKKLGITTEKFYEKIDEFIKSEFSDSEV
ncbi:HDOD domain-containing protein [Clostridiaceae bacterium HSG29]|nr:HDOD domain-containing protein [Clostridiaceae bacterium HSG29]